MKKIIFIIAIVLFTFEGFCNPILPADTLRIDGKLVLWLGFEGYEAGWSYGYLLGDRIADVMENYLVAQAFGGAANFQAARQIFDEHFIYDAKYEHIAQGMIEGIEAAEVSLYSNILGENFTWKDILIGNSIPDFTSLGVLKTRGPGCSDLMSWGQATENDPELGGDLVISRNLDWDNDPYLINNSLMIIWASPSGSNQRIITFGFVGLIGALSGINESGIATFQNMGNHNMPATGTDFYPVNLAQRDGLESWDYNNDGECSPRDVSDAVRSHNVSSTYIINTAGSNSRNYPAEILEIHNQIGETIRTVDDNFGDLGDNLVSTNHFRKLMAPVYCYRYDRISDSLETSNQLGISRNWRVLQSAGVSNNLQTIQYIPYLDRLRFSFAEIGTPAYQIEPTEVRLDTLFNIVGINELSQSKKSFVNVVPNPCHDRATISFNAPVEGKYICSIYNMVGEMIFEQRGEATNKQEVEIGWGTSQTTNGVYFCQLNFINNKNLKVFCETKKIVVSK